MSQAEIAVTLDEELLSRLDKLVNERRFPDRSRAVQEALRDKLDRLDRDQFALECGKLDPKEERELAEEGMAGDFKQWPPY